MKKTLHVVFDYLLSYFIQVKTLFFCKSNNVKSHTVKAKRARGRKRQKKHGNMFEHGRSVKRHCQNGEKQSDSTLLLLMRLFQKSNFIFSVNEKTPTMRDQHTHTGTLSLRIHLSVTPMMIVRSNPVISHSYTCII